MLLGSLPALRASEAQLAGVPAPALGASRALGPSRALVVTLSGRFGPSAARQLAGGKGSRTTHQPPKPDSGIRPAPGAVRGRADRARPPTGRRGARPGAPSPAAARPWKTGAVLRLHSAAGLRGGGAGRGGSGGRRQRGRVSTPGRHVGGQSLQQLG